MGGIATRVAVLSSLVVLVATATVGFLVYQGAQDSLIRSASDRVAHTAENIKVGTWGSIGAIGDDVRFLAATPPVQGIVRARLRRGLDPMWSIRDDEWGVQLAETFRSFLESRSSYLQVRFVGLGDEGLELVRVERRDGEAVFADVGDFQRLGHLDYVSRGRELPPGSLYLSEVSWTDAKDHVAPNAPVFHISTPVYSANGEAFGVVAVTVDFSSIVAPMESLVDSNQTLYVAGDDGDLLHLRSPDSLGADARILANLQALYPNLDSLIGGSTSSTRMLDARLGDGSGGIAYFEMIPMSGVTQSPRLMVGVVEPHETILADVRRVRDTSALITLLLCLAAIGLALSTSRYITNPIRRISQAVAAFGGDGDRVELPVDRDDELGLLSRSFESMEQQIQMQMQFLEDEERRQRTILETAAEGIIVVDRSGRIEAINPAAESIFGVPARDVMGRQVRDLLPAVDLEVGSVDGESNQAPGIETSGLRGDGGKVPLAVVWSSFKWRDEERFTIFVQDISARKEDEEARERLVRELESERKSLHELSRTLEARVQERTAELEQLNRELNASNRELREIASVASHDLQEPLRKLRSFADLLETEYGPALDDDGRFYARRIFNLAERMSLLLSDLLSFSRVTLGTKKLRNVDLRSIALQAIENLEPTIAKCNGAVHLEHLPELEADPRQMRELLENLIENALSYRRPDAPPVARIRGSVEDDGSGRRVYRIEVEDNGLGFDEKYVDRIFAPFERLHDRRAPDGTGMGLTICRRIVENHLGTITARSIPGVGSTFVITIPANGT